MRHLFTFSLIAMTACSSSTTFTSRSVSYSCTTTSKTDSAGNDVANCSCEVSSTSQGSCDTSIADSDSTCCAVNWPIAAADAGYDPTSPDCVCAGPSAPAFDCTEPTATSSSDCTCTIGAATLGKSYSYSPGYTECSIGSGYNGACCQSDDGCYCTATVSTTAVTCKSGYTKVAKCDGSGLGLTKQQCDSKYTEVSSCTTQKFPASF